MMNVSSLPTFFIMVPIKVDVAFTRNVVRNVNFNTTAKLTLTINGQLAGESLTPANVMEQINTHYESIFKKRMQIVIDFALPDVIGRLSGQKTDDHNYKLSKISEWIDGRIIEMNKSTGVSFKDKPALEKTISEQQRWNIIAYWSAVKLTEVYISYMYFISYMYLCFHTLHSYTGLL